MEADALMVRSAAVLVHDFKLHISAVLLHIHWIILDFIISFF